MLYIYHFTPPYLIANLKLIGCFLFYILRIFVMNKAFLFTLMISSTPLMSLGYDNYGLLSPFSSNSSSNYDDGLGYIMHSTSAGDFVSGPCGYRGFGHQV